MLLKIINLFEGLLIELLGEFPHLSSDTEMLIEYLQKNGRNFISELLDKILNFFYIN